MIWDGENISVRRLWMELYDALFYRKTIKAIQINDKKTIIRRDKTSMW